MKHLPSFSGCVAMLASVAAGAVDTGNPGGMLADTPGIESGRPSADHANAQDRLFVPHFTLIEERREIHTTPGGVAQPFAYALLRRREDP